MNQANALNNYAGIGAQVVKDGSDVKRLVEQLNRAVSEAKSAGWKIELGIKGQRVIAEISTVV